MRLISVLVLVKKNFLDYGIGGEILNRIRRFIELKIEICVVDS